MTASNNRNRLAAASATGSALSIVRPADAMTRQRTALIGGFRPRMYGIATITTDIYEQLGVHHEDVMVDLDVIDDHRASLAFEDVRGTIRADRQEDYRNAARRINEDAVDTVWLQHEYRIFGGEAGEMVLDLVDRLAAPLIVTLHTVLAEPSAKQRKVLEHLLRRASRVMVMSAHSQQLLRDHYDVDAGRIALIPHCAPGRPFGREEERKAKLGLAGKQVMMTFGLPGPALGKGLVSTPHVHARGLLANGDGVLIEPRNPGVIAQAVNRLLDDPAELRAIKRRAWKKGRETIWRCRDGVTPQGVNLNWGAESILAFQLANYAMCRLTKRSGAGKPVKGMLTQGARPN